MSVKYYRVISDDAPDENNPYTPYFKHTPYGRSYGYFNPDGYWVEVVHNAHFDVVAIAYDDDKDEYSTLLAVLCPDNETTEPFSFWWESDDEHSACEYLARHYGVNFNCNSDQFLKLLMLYRASSEALTYDEVFPA